MRVIENRVLPIGKRFYAINLCGILFAKGPCDRFVINHEKIHTAQIKELLVVGFYLWYVVEWIWKAIRYRSFYKAYENVSFEREAYAHGDDLGYLPGRKNYAFLRYISKNK